MTKEVNLFKYSLKVNYCSNNLNWTIIKNNIKIEPVLLKIICQLKDYEFIV